MHAQLRLDLVTDSTIEEYSTCLFQNSSGCFCLSSHLQSIQVTLATGRPICPYHHAASTMFHTRCAALSIISCSRSSPNFPLPIILVQVDISLIFLKNAVPELSWLPQVDNGKVNSNLSVFEADQWFAPCGEAFVLTLMTSSLYGGIKNSSAHCSSFQRIL